MKYESNVIKTLTCELRSVMVNVYWVNNFSMTKLGGEDIGEYGDGYYSRLFSTK